VADNLEAELDEIEGPGLALRTHNVERPKLARGTTHERQAASATSRPADRLPIAWRREGTDAIKPALRVAAGKLAQRLDALDHDLVQIARAGPRLPAGGKSIAVMAGRGPTATSTCWPSSPRCSCRRP